MPNKDKDIAAKQNRKSQATWRARAKDRRQRVLGVMGEFTQYVTRDPSQDDTGQCAYHVRMPDAVYRRFEELAREHGRTAKQLLDESMVIYFEELRRLKDEQS